jgi:hypothetical protein
MRANDFITELRSHAAQNPKIPVSQQVMTEDADAGSTSSPTIAVSFEQQGKLPTEMIRRQTGYTNQLSKGGAVNVKKSK